MRIAVIIRAGLRLIGRLLRREPVEVIAYDSGLRPAPPFHVPLRIAAVGDEAHDIIEATQSLLAERSIQVEWEFVRLPEHLAEKRHAHIVVFEASQLKRAVAATYAGIPGAATPALMLVLGTNGSLLVRLHHAPEGAAVLAARHSSASDLLCEIVTQIGLDVPLERAIRKAAQVAIKPGGSALLIMDHAVNDALRVGDAAECMEMEAELAWGPRAGPPGASSRRLWDLFAPAPIPESFGRFGPRPLDINLLHATYREGDSRRVKRGTTLKSGTPYLVEVHVGTRLGTSIIRGESIEGGPVRGTRSEADVLDVVLQGKEIAVESGNTRQLVVPPQNASRMIFFVVRTPAKTGMASMRMVVYRRNQMLRSYLIQAQITEQEVEFEAPDRGVTATLDFSFNKDLEQWEEGSKTEGIAVPGPVLTLAVNQDPQGTHSILAKGSEGAASFSITESGVSENLRKFRDLLLEASYVTLGKEKKVTQRRWTEEPSEASDQYIRRLADFGCELYRSYLNNTAPGLRETLKTIRRNSDEVISIVRIDERFAFPWPVLYDMHLPTGWTRKVCYGELEPGVPCGHGADSRAYCIRGFWGYRHRIEELIGNRESKDTVSNVVKLPGSLQFLHDASIPPLEAKDPGHVLAALSGAQPAQPKDGDALLDQLWNVASRPSMFVVFGHLTAEPKEGEPTGTRIPIPGTSPQEWLMSRQILEYLDDHDPWSDRNPVVVLLTCDSMATNPATLTDFVVAFHRARAGAIIGTECLAFSDCVSRFSQRFFPLLWERGIPLGEAMTEVRRALLQKGYPLAFIFSAIGRADLRVR